jgi:WD40 repeat protein
VPATPYRGIRAFRYVDHPIFFARDEETRVLASLVAVYRGVLLYGASGNGKSSLVNAGLMPAARELRFAPARVRVQPRAGEELVVERVASSDDRDPTLAPVLAHDEDGSPRVVMSISEFEQRVRAVAREHRPLLIFDQFEEILTLFEDGAAFAARAALAAMVVRLLREPVPVKVVLAFREDYLGRVKQLLSACPELVDQALRLGPPSADALQTIIRGPFERYPGHFARQLPPSLARRLSAALAERFGTGDVSLSEVQTVCLRLWQADDAASMLAEKGVQGLLEDELGQALSALPQHLRAPAVAVMSHMVTSAGTRNVVSAEDLRQRISDDDAGIEPELVGEALDLLERESKLIRSERRRELYLYEITSEFLVPWISRRREELQLAQERRRGRRRIRIISSIAAVLLIAFAGVAIIAVVAVHEKTKATAAAATARSLALAAATDEPPSDRPDASLALAYEAYLLRPQREASQALIGARLGAHRSGLRGVLTTDQPLRTVAFSTDGKMLAAASAKGHIDVWDTETRERVRKLPGIGRDLDAVALSPDAKSFAYANDGRIYIDTLDGRTHVVLRSGGAPIQALAFSPRGTMLGAADSKGIVHLWNTGTSGRLPQVTARHCAAHLLPNRTSKTRCAVRAVAFSPDDRWLATAGEGGTVRLQRVSSRRGRGEERTFQAFRSGMSIVAFRPNGRELAAAGVNGKVRIFPVTSPASAKTLDGKAGPVYALAYGHDGTLVTASRNHNTISLWNVAEARQSARLIGPDGGVTAVALSRDGTQLVSAGVGSVKNKGAVHLWDPATRNVAPRVLDWGDPVIDSAYGSDGATFVSLTSRPLKKAEGIDPGVPDRRDPGTVTLRAAASHKALHSTTVKGANAVAFRPRLNPVAAAAQNPSAPVERNMIAIATERGMMIWDGVARHAHLVGRAVAVRSVAFSDKGDVLISGNEDGSIRVWRTVPRPAVRTPLVSAHGADSAPRPPVKTVALSPDGTLAAAADEFGTVRLWRRLDGSDPGKALIRGEPGIDAIAFSTDSKILAAGSGRDGELGVVLLWQTPGGERLKPLEGGDGRVSALAFRADGGLASGGGGQPIRLWNLGAHDPWLGPVPESSGARHIAFSPDDRTLLAVMVDGTVRIWRDVVWTGLEDLSDDVCSILGPPGVRDLTPYARGTVFHGCG